MSVLCYQKRIELLYQHLRCKCSIQYTSDYSLADLLFGFEQSEYTVAEDDGAVTVCVNITEVPAGGFEDTIVVSLMSVDGNIAGLPDLNSFMNVCSLPFH